MDDAIKSGMWYYSNGRYFKVNKATLRFVNGHGIWIKLKDDCNYTFSGTPLTIDKFPVLKKGWNSIGAPGETVDFANVSGNCNVLSGPWKYNTLSKNYENVTQLVPGEGYWLKLDGTCKLSTPVELPPSTEEPPTPPE